MQKSLLSFLGASLAVHMLALTGWQLKTPVNEIRPSGNGSITKLEIQLIGTTPKRAPTKSRIKEKVAQPQHQQTTDSKENKRQQRQMVAKNRTNTPAKTTNSSRPGNKNKIMAVNKPEQHVPKLTFTARNYESLTNLRVVALTKPGDENTTAIQSTAADKGTQQDTNKIATHLKQMFSKYFHYPRLARRNGWQGMVKLGLRIEPDGQLSHIRILKTSGFKVLDQAAIDSINKIAALPGAGDWLRGSHFDTVLPVRYKLLDS